MNILRKYLPLLLLGINLAGCAVQRAPSAFPLPPTSLSPPPQEKAVDHFIRAVVLEQQGDITRAIGEYRRALQYDSSASTIYLSLAEDYYLLKLYDDAIYYLQGALRVDTNNVAALEFLSDLLLESNQYDSAISVAQKLISLSPENLHYRQSLAGIYLRQERPAEAIQQYEAILQEDSSDTETLKQLSTIYIAIKDFKRALDISQRLFAQDSTDDRVNFTIASLLAELDRASEADQYFARTIELNKDDPRYFTNWAFLHMGNKNYSRAIQILQRGAQHHPKAADIWGLLGSAYERAGQDSSALKALDHSLELDATQIGPYITLGYVFDRRGEYQKALDVYNQAIAIAPEDPLLLNNYAYLLAQRQVRLDEALQMVQKALDKAPENSSYLDTIGWVYFGLGDYAKAREYIERALEKDKNNAEVLHHLGDIYEALGDKTKARECWRQALEFDQENVKLREKLAQ